MRRTISAIFVLVVTTHALGQGARVRPTVPSGRETDLRPIPEVLADAAARYESYKQTKDAGTFQEVMALLGVALGREPQNTEANLMSAEIALESNDYDTGREYFRAVLNVEPNNFRANLGMGRIWIATRSFRQAMLFLQTAERVAPDTEKASEVKQLLASTYVASGDVPRAIEKAEEAVRVSPENPEALHTLAVIRTELAKRDPTYVAAAVKDAEAYLARMREIAQQNPADVDKLQKLEAAYGILIDALRLLHNANYERDARGQATTRLLKGKEADAAAALNRMAEVMLDKSTVSMMLMQHDIINIAAQPAVALDPKSVKYLELLASLYEKTGNRPKAIETAQKILELDANHQGARDFLRSVNAAGPAPTTQPAVPG